ncbi:hypothetical protein BX600DRAFT_550925 [Xylariales sp. PMI_506]|nr:hypothetical protein BX600DRAFT_550925 [Xylariales sp. PMI_506]
MVLGRAVCLPPEILSRIVFFLTPLNKFGTDLDKPWRGDDSLAKYAVVSKQWQTEVERHTFGHIFLSTRRLASDEARQTLTPSRFRLVHTINLEAVLDEYDDEARTRVETSQEQHRNSKRFTSMLVDFFALLKPLEATQALTHQDRKRTLILGAYSPSDTWREPGRGVERRRWRLRYLIPDILDYRYLQSHLELLECDLPSLSFISHFQIPQAWHQYRFINPGACCIIASKLNKLDSIVWHLSDNEKRDLDLRRRLRRDMARCLPALPPSLSHIQLTYSHDPPHNETFEPANIVGPKGTPDPVSVALRDVCQCLETATISAALTPEFFWPTFVASSADNGSDEKARDIRGESPQLHWPRLRKLQLGICPADPSGRWLHERYYRYRTLSPEDGYATPSDDGIEDGEPDTPADEDRWPKYFRGSPNETTMAEWLLAAGQAAARMPLLEDLWFGTGATAIGWYLDYNVARRAVQVESGPVFASSPTVVDAWQRVGTAHAPESGELTIEFRETTNKNGLWQNRPIRGQLRR